PRQHLVGLGPAGAGRGGALGQGAARPAAAARGLRRRLHLGLGATAVLIDAAAASRTGAAMARQEDAGWERKVRSGAWTSRVASPGSSATAARGARCACGRWTGRRCG